MGKQGIRREREEDSELLEKDTQSSKPKGRDFLAETLLESRKAFQRQTQVKNLFN